VRSLARDEQATSITSVRTVVHNLISERKVAHVSDQVCITPKGMNSLIYDNRTKKRARLTLSFLSDLRLKALNLTLRKGNGKIWAGRRDLSRACL
jgi:hypothetical protein